MVVVPNVCRNSSVYYSHNYTTFSMSRFKSSSSAAMCCLVLSREEYLFCRFSRASSVSFTFAVSLCLGKEVAPKRQRYKLLYNLGKMSCYQPTSLLLHIKATTRAVFYSRLTAVTVYSWILLGVFQLLDLGGSLRLKLVLPSIGIVLGRHQLFLQSCLCLLLLLQ